MPLLFSSVTASLCHKPQEMFKVFQKGEEAIADTMRCLPMTKRNSSKSLAEKEAIRKLTQDVELLHEQFPENSVDAGPDPGETESLRLSLSQDVQTQVRQVFALLKELTSEGASRPACQRNKPVQESQMELLEDMLAKDIPVQLLEELPLLEFEARKDVMNLCCALLWSEMPSYIEDQVLDYIRQHPRAFCLLADGYGNEETALHYGVVLRSCARHAELVEAFLKSGRIFDLMQHIHNPQFDIASDAFYTLKEFLLEHKDVSAAWLDQNSAAFFQEFNALLQSDHYLMERQALILLGGILLDKQFKKVTLAYVNNDKNLQICMNLLKDGSKAIQVEAFHVFKVFVANPNKSVRVHRILFKNKEKLVTLLETLHSKSDTPTFCEEQRRIIDKLRPLSPPCSPIREKSVIGM